MRLADRVALVTGAARGIGREIALRFAREGAAVVVADVDTAGVDRVAAELKVSGSRGFGVEVDVASSAAVRRMVSDTLGRLGRIDVLVNNAGVISFSPFLDLAEEEWDRVYAINVKGVFLCSKAVGRHMKERQEGRIINISSIAGKTAGLYAPHYASSKAAVISLTQALARELAPYRVRVNAICPGFVETEMLRRFEETQARALGLGEEAVKKSYLELSGWYRMGTPGDVADLAVFLASEESDYITAQAINVCATGELH
jgi:meso-butanediol dehydrogenase/(S,S)-butanediol dehydrogenase/diacetyl reductase